MKDTFMRSFPKGNPEDPTIIGQWLVDRIKLRKSLKTLAPISRDDFLHYSADEMMLQTLGVLTLTWAIMERAVDDIVALVFAADADQAIQSTVPVTLENKLDYLRKARAEMPSLAPFTERMRGVQSRIKLARKHRKNVTHGVLEVADEDRHIWRAKVLDFKGDASAETTVEYGSKSLFATIREIDALASDLQALLGDLRPAFDAPE